MTALSGCPLWLPLLLSPLPVALTVFAALSRGAASDHFIEEPIKKALRSGAIRLVRCTWLLESSDTLKHVDSRVELVR